MIDVRPVFFIIGWLLVMLAGAMLLPAAVEYGRAESEAAVFLVGAAITLFAGGLLVAVCRSVRPNSRLRRTLTLRQSFLMAVLSWVVLGAFAALPLLLLSDIDLSLTDAVFEAVSGITTTGSTVLTGLDGMAPGILLWRALLQWLGGRPPSASFREPRLRSRRCSGSAACRSSGSNRATGPRRCCRGRRRSRAISASSTWP